MLEKLNKRRPRFGSVRPLKTLQGACGGQLGAVDYTSALQVGKGYSRVAFQLQKFNPLFTLVFTQIENSRIFPFNILVTLFDFVVG